jgi:hypothetical protein
LFEIGEGKVIDQGDGLAQLVLEVEADFLVGALAHAGQNLQTLRIVLIEINFEMIGLIAAPGKGFIDDSVLAVIRIFDDLAGQRGGQEAGGQEEKETGRAEDLHGVSSLSEI